MEICQKIRNLREEAGKSQQELAEYLETTQTYYGQYELGNRDIPIHRLIKLARLYNLSLDYLAGIIDEPRPLYKENRKTKEQELITKYNEKKEYQKAINKLLDIKP